MAESERAEGTVTVSPPGRGPAGPAVPSGPQPPAARPDGSPPIPDFAVPPPAPRRAPRRRPVVWGLAAAGLLLLVLLAQTVIRVASPPPAPTPAPTPPPLTARGVVSPLARARIASTTGGTVTRVAVGEGDAVTAYQELAVVRAAAGVETLTAPWAGTVVALPVRAGDSIAPGAVVATIGDLSRLRVETTDVDEYIVWQLRRGQPVAVRIDALDRRQIPGYVRSVATQPEPGTAGSQHYPVTIDLVENPPELRLGMTTRITFSQDPAPSLP